MNGEPIALSRSSAVQSARDASDGNSARRFAQRILSIARHDQSSAISIGISRENKVEPSSKVALSEIKLDTLCSRGEVGIRKIPTPTHVRASRVMKGRHRGTHEATMTGHEGHKVTGSQNLRREIGRIDARARTFSGVTSAQRPAYRLFSARLSERHGESCERRRRRRRGRGGEGRGIVFPR
jgi:hypothetical protein